MKSAKQKTGQRPDTDVRHARIVDAAIQSLRDDLPNSVSLKMMATKFGLSVSFLSRIFTEQKGMKFSAFARKAKHGAAKKLLQDPFIRIAVVARKAGFKSAAHFSSSFKKVEKMSPTECRARILNNEVEKTRKTRK